MDLLHIRQRIIGRYRLPPDLPEWLDSLWIDQEIENAEREIAELTECIEGSAAISGTSTARTYAKTTDFIRVMRASWASNSALDKRNIDQLMSEGGDAWRNATGQPARWYEEGARLIGFYPKVRAGSAGTFIAYGPRYPTPMATNSASSELPTALHRARDAYVCRELADMDPSQKGDREYNKWERRYRNEVARYKHVRPYVLTFRARRNA